jgi:AAA+ superfamily predicted ATPase
MQGEHDPSQSPQGEGWAEVSFGPINADHIEELTWQDMGWLTIAEMDSIPLPIHSLRIEMDGSSLLNGNYTLRTSLLLAPTNDDDERPDDFFDDFASAYKGEALEESETQFLINSPGGYQYIWTLEDKGLVISIETCGKNWEEVEDLNRRAKMQLGHDDNFYESFGDFLSMNKEMLAFLYNSYQVNNIKLTIPIKSPEPIGEVEITNLFEKDLEEPRLKLDDLGGIQEIKDELMETVLALQHPEVFDAYLLERSHGIFLYGPPGTGKTTLAKAIAGELSADFREVKSSDIYGKWMGESERAIQKIFDDALEATQPLVLLFDEVDGIILPRSGSTYSAVATLFKQQIGKLSETNPNVIVVATSNKQPNEIDEALFRPGRFDKHIYVPLPSEADRKDIFITCVSKYFHAPRNIFHGDINFDRLAEVTDGLNGADITTIIRKAVSAMAYYELRTKQVAPPIETKKLIEITTSYRSAKA